MSRRTGVGRFALLGVSVTLLGMPSVRADQIRLKNGNTVEGAIVAETEQEVTVELSGLGTMAVSRGEISTIERSPTAVSPSPLTATPAEDVENHSVVAGESAWAIYDQLVKKAASLGSFRCEIKTYRVLPPSDESPPLTMTGTIWQKGSYGKHEGRFPLGEPFLMVSHPDALYLYDWTTNTYMKQPLPPAAQVGALWQATKEQSDITVLGTALVEGKETTLFEQVDPVLQTTSKVWMWNDTGLPIRIESGSRPTDGSPATLDVQELKGFVFEDIPDSVFEIPETVERN